MNNLSWFYPETETESLELLNKGYRPHAGGTFLVKTSLNIKGLFDLSCVKKLKSAENHGNFLTLGAALTYAEAAAFIEKEVPGNLLSKALSSAAATPLRNRISIGGSIAAAPKWSDIIAPLYSTEASVVIAGRDEAMGFDLFMKDRVLRKNSLITAVNIPLDSLKGSYYRFTVTGFDYPLFCIAASIKKDGAYSCAVTGAAGGIKLFNGRADAIASEAETGLKFNNERGFSGDYIKSRAVIELKRLLTTKGASNV